MNISSPHVSRSGYLTSCHTVVTCACNIVNAITTSIPSLYVLGSPPASVVAFASRDKNVDMLEVGDAMRKRGWHLTAITEPRGVHIACTVRLPFISHSSSAKLKTWKLTVDIETHLVSHGHFRGGS